MTSGILCLMINGKHSPIEINEQGDWFGRGHLLIPRKTLLSERESFPQIVMAGFNPDSGRAYPAETTERASRSLASRRETSHIRASFFLCNNTYDLSTASSVSDWSHLVLSMARTLEVSRPGPVELRDAQPTAVGWGEAPPKFCRAQSETTTWSLR